MTLPPPGAVVLVTSAEAVAVAYPQSGEQGIARLIERFFSPADRQRLDALSGGVVRVVSALPREGRFITETRWQELHTRPRRP